MNKILFLFYIIPVLCIGCTGNNSKVVQQQNIPNSTLITMDNDTVQLTDIIVRNHLIFRYSVLDCRSCIDTVFSLIKKYEYKIGKENIIIFTYYNNIRDFVVSVRSKNLDYNYFQVPENKFFTDKENLSIPYFFCIDEKMQPHNFFFIMNINEQKGQLINYLLNIDL